MTQKKTWVRTKTSGKTVEQRHLKDKKGGHKEDKVNNRNRREDTKRFTIPSIQLTAPQVR